MRKSRHVSTALASIVAPISGKAFFKNYWTRQPLLIQRRDPKHFSILPDSSAFEFLVASLTSAQSGWFSLVNERARRPADSMLTDEGFLNLAEVFASHGAGNSLLLSQIQKRHRATGVFCRQLEIDLTEAGVALSRQIGANAYLSPPNSQGFSIHYDPHDVFVCQLEGHKLWRLYRREVVNPVDPPPAPTPPDVAGPPLMECTLGPGDSLYIPRGVLHDARTGDESSLHLTLSVYTVTWRDVLSEILSRDEGFRESLPLHFLSDAASADGTCKTEALARLGGMVTNTSHLGDALSKATERLFASLNSLPNGGFDSIRFAESLKPETRLSRAVGVFGRVEMLGNSAILHLPGSSFRGGHEMEPTFRTLLTAPVIRPRDLPIAVSADEKLKFMRGLVLSGYFVPAPPAKRKHRRKGTSTD